ncbi:nicotinate-nucleotide--dimethylbenzimidazole phosphoribosyltransferase [Peptacetobacter hominis]|uniref:Nicotinate-nucleotide--dimethylbenzimidazole phosphoribosyltransferase n=1 Tax=Peptacetobacter hominis TaxID=2743610 RepID=A0A544QT33_9FIRM|nr:nicotinate-nucleotide--dimethylbenzimidazole phosphoribosyltransferase [Peptacetobacter hominis]TQQ83198.1 nicotinate-nucleotide--dimethylbenzimidazole phosphoribosyltransferase [Peptacetobacter hominis]
MNLLSSISRNIYPLNQKSMDAAQKKWDSLIHPKGSLGRLEEICIQLAGVYETEKFDISKKAIIAFAADHGVYDEGVAPNPQEITKLQFPNFVNGKCGVGVLSRFAGASVVAVDVGINCDEKLEGVIDRKIRKGTSNMLKGPAMTREEAVKSIEIGIEVAEEFIVNDYGIIGIGEMGISNTTASTAIISVITGQTPEEITGAGAGLSEKKISHKARVIGKAIEINDPNPTDGIEVLEKVGGFEIGAMSGVILGCAANRIPVVIDGFISYAAALIAYKINPGIKDYLIPSHNSAEPGSQVALEMLGLRPMLEMDMRLGEGSGAALAFNIIDAAIYAYNNMATFDEVGMHI